MQVRRGVEAEREAEDLAVLELSEKELRLCLNPAEVLEDLGERPVRDTSAIRWTAACQSPWRRRRGSERIPQLAREATLSHACLADDRDELGPSVRDDAIVGGLQELELACTTHECGLACGVLSPPGGRERPDETPTHDTLGLSLCSDGSRRIELERALDSRGRALRNEDLARSSRLLEAGGDVDSVAARERATDARLSHDALPGVDADPELHTSANQLREPPLHRNRRVERPLGVVLMGGGNTEHCHDGVADELLDGAPRLPDLGRHRIVEAVEQCSRPFGVLG